MANEVLTLELHGDTWELPDTSEKRVRNSYEENVRRGRARFYGTPYPPDAIRGAAIDTLHLDDAAKWPEGPCAEAPPAPVPGDYSKRAGVFAGVDMGIGPDKTVVQTFVRHARQHGATHASVELLGALMRAGVRR
jgi:hypothetical protein